MMKTRGETRPSPVPLYPTLPGPGPENPPIRWIPEGRDGWTKEYLSPTGERYDCSRNARQLQVSETESPGIEAKRR